MTPPETRNPVLDKQFHLHTILRETPFSVTFRATHVAGHDAVIKLVYREDLFFDELARLYALDESPFFCRCFYNYPPESVSKKSLPLDRPLSQIHHTAGNAAPESVGILVMEAPEGVRLSELAEQLDEIELVNLLMEITYAVRHLAENDLGHHNLIPDNVLVNREAAEIKLVDLGWHPDRDDPDCRLMSPEHRETSVPGPEADIYMFGANFLSMLKRRGLIRKLRKRCMDPDPAERPDPAEIQQGLKNYRRKLHPKPTRAILFGFLRPVNLAVWTVTILFGIVLLPYLESDPPPLSDRYASILNDKKMAPEERVTQLRQLWPEADEGMREELAHDIAQEVVLTGTPKLLNKMDKERPIAVFVFKNGPMIIGRNEIYRIGDWVEMDGAEDSLSYIADIQFNRFKLVYEDAYSWHYFDKPNFYIGLVFSHEVALVWDNPGNLNRLLSAIADLEGLEFHDEEREHGLRKSGGGKVSGIFVTSTPGELLQQLREAISIEIEKNSLRLKRDEGKLPVYFKFMGLEFNNANLAIFAIALEHQIGYKVSVEDSIKSHQISIKCYNITWQELLDELDLSWHVKESIDGKILIIDGVEKSKETFREAK